MLRDGRWLLTLDMRPPHAEGAKPVIVRVTKVYGAGEAAAYAAKNRAHHLRRDVRVLVSGGCISARRGGVALTDVDRVETPDLVLHNRGQKDD